jgi:hypothetical protein
MFTYKTLLNFLLPKVLSIDPLTIAGIGAGISGLGSFFGSKSAGEAQESAAEKGAAVQKEMFDISREDMLPFLESAVGAPSGFEEYQLWSGLPVGMKAGSTPWGVGDVLPNQEKITRVEDIGGGLFNVYGQRPAIDTTTGRTERQPGALDLYQKGIVAAPAVPTLPGAYQAERYTPEFAEQGQRFAGGRFGYDPYEAMQSPDIQFLQQQGEQAMERQLAKNRKLGSGNRLIDAMKFNQGLAAQGLQDYFNRQYTMDRENYLRDLGEEEAAYGRGLTERELGVGDYQRNIQTDLGNYQRQLNRLLGQYDLDRGAYDTRMNRLADLINVGSGAGKMTSQGALATGRGLAGSYADLGEAQAAGTLGRMNAITNTLGDLGYLYGMSQNPYRNPYTQTSGQSFLNPVTSNVRLGL